MHKFLKLALREAANFSYNENYAFRLCAVIVGGGSVLSIGFNNSSRNGFVQSLEAYDTSEKPFINTHAEVNAILRVRNKVDLTGCKIYVARVRRLDHLAAMAKPCDVCQIALARYGIRRAYYTIDSNNYGVLSIKSQGNTTDKVCHL